MHFIETFEKFNNFGPDLKKLYKLKDSIIKKIKKFKKFNFPEITISISDLGYKKGIIGAYIHPENDDDHGLITIHYKALHDEEYLKWVMTHELIHATFGKPHKNVDSHNKAFKELAAKMGMPEKYMN